MSGGAERQSPCRASTSLFLFIEMVLFGLLPGNSLAQAPWPQITLVKKFTGLTSPTFVTNAGDGTGRLFVVRQAGVIRVVTKVGLVRPVNFFTRVI